MKRSRFVYLSLVGAAAISVPSLYCKNQDETYNKVLSQPRFLSHICDAKTIREIGKAYKETLPSETKEDELVDILLKDSTGKPLSQTSDNSLVTALLNKKIEQDFDAGRTVVVKGWILAVTEAQQCALFSLS